jgi:LPS export ABC transporter protein LptC
MGYGKQLLRGIVRAVVPKRTYGSSRRLQLVLLGVALLIVAVALGTAFREKRKAFVIKSKEIQNPPGEANLEVNNIVYGYTNKHNAKEWELRSDKARYFKDKKIIELENLEVVFYRSNGTIYRLTGKRGTIEMETENFTVQGDITGVMPDNTRFSTQSFSYDNKKRVVTTPDKVFITRDTFSMEGVGMIIDIKEEKLSLLNNVKATENK